MIKVGQKYWIGFWWPGLQLRGEKIWFVVAFKFLLSVDYCKMVYGFYVCARVDAYSEWFQPLIRILLDLMMRVAVLCSF